MKMLQALLRENQAWIMRWITLEFWAALAY
jgi:hypothetical protein